MTDRRDFLGLLGATTLAGAFAPRTVAAAGAPAQPFPTWYPRPRAAEWDMSWLKRLHGKYRVVFDAPEVSEGDPVLRAVVWAHQMTEVFGATKGEMSRVLVLRHNGIAMAMQDSYWARFRIAEPLGLNDGAGKPLAVNPVRTARAEVPEPFRYMTLEQFQEDGGIILACDLALRHYVVANYASTGLGAEAAYQQAVANLLPGIILQPSGIFAVSVAQDAGCRFVPAS